MACESEPRTFVDGGRASGSSEDVCDEDGDRGCEAVEAVGDMEVSDEERERRELASVSRT